MVEVFFAVSKKKVEIDLNMNEDEYTSTDSSTSDSDNEMINSDKKALPWHSTDLVKREALPEDDMGSASGFSTSISNKMKNCSNDNALSEQSLLLNIDKSLKITSDDKNSPRTSFAEVEIQKKAIPYENPFSLDSKTEDVDMKDPPTEINLLLLGESGVGKSTFINSFANYMKHANFEAVQNNDLSVLIPARFSIFDKEFKKHVIDIGANDENEFLADGAAATQDVKTYVFYITLENKSYLIRLIDTPGMGDPRGIDQDNKNCDYVLNYIGKLEKIHAICLLLKPINTRLDVFLNYCITQILSRLEKSATDNIAFLFTNTRGQNYTPGDTYTSLEVLVKKIKDTNNVSLPLSHENVFCFDNEAFRFLASIKQGVQFREGILEANIESWKYSYKEIYRVLSYIVKLKPHDPKKTISINHARKLVLQLSQPLAEIVQLIGDNIYQLDQHTNQLLMENQTLDELKQKLYMPVIDIRVKELDQPVTVCTAPECSTIYKVADKNKFHYKQRCHNPCYLNNVPAEIVGDPHILGCWAITKSTQTCHECGCRFNTHMHIYYETDTFETKIVDQNIQKNITSKEDAAIEKQTMINKILNHKEQLEKEHKYIIKCSAEFAHFLQQNAITPINDSLKEYVKYLITREESLGPECNRTTLDYLRRLLSEYEQEKNVLEEALKHNSSATIASSPDVIERKIRDLFTLPNFGKKIKQLYDLHQSVGLREHQQSEYIVKERYTLSIMDKVKSYGSAVMGAIGLKSKKQPRHRLELEQERSIAWEKSVRKYDNELQRNPRLQSNLEFSGQYYNPYYLDPSLGPIPNDPRNLYNNQPYYSLEEKEYFLALERLQRRRQYELDYNRQDENGNSDLNSRQYSGEQSNASNHKPLFDSRNKYFGNGSVEFERNRRDGHHQIDLHSGETYFGKTDEKDKDFLAPPRKGKGASNSKTKKQLALTTAQNVIESAGLKKENTLAKQSRSSESDDVRVAGNNEKPKNTFEVVPEGKKGKKNKNKNKK